MLASVFENVRARYRLFLVEMYRKILVAYLKVANGDIGQLRGRSGIEEKLARPGHMARPWHYSRTFGRALGDVQQAHPEHVWEPQDRSEYVIIAAREDLGVDG